MRRSTNSRRRRLVLSNYHDEEAESEAEDLPVDDANIDIAGEGSLERLPNFSDAVAQATNDDSRIQVLAGVDIRKCPEVGKLFSQLIVPRKPRTPVELRVTRLHDGKTFDLRVRSTFSIVGSGPDCQLKLIDPSVKDRELVFQRIGHRILCISLCGKHQVRHRPGSHRFRWLVPDDELVVGAYGITCLRGVKLSHEDLEVPPVDVDTLFEPWVDESESDAASWNGSPKSAFLPLDGENAIEMRLDSRLITLIGRGTFCGFRVADPHVSRVHGAVLSTVEGVWIQDFETPDGIRVNGECVRRSQLHEGDEIQIGRSRFRFTESFGSDAGNITVTKAESTDEPQTETGDESESSPEQTDGLKTIPEFLVDSGTPSDESDLDLTRSLMWVIQEQNSTPAFCTSTLTPPDPAQGIVEGVNGALARMQQEMQQQFRQQTEMLTTLVDSIRRDIRDELSEEIRQLARITTEIQRVQHLMYEKLAGESVSPGSQTPESAKLITDKEHSKERSLNAPPTGRGISPTQMDDSDETLDPMNVIVRLRELENERTSRWQKLLRLVQQP